MSGDAVNIKENFFPIRLTAFSRNSVEMEITAENRTKKVFWIEVDVKVPEAISLAPDQVLSHGRTRVGILLPGGEISKKIKIFSGASSYPDTYKIKLTAYIYNENGAIEERIDKKVGLRCIRMGEEE